MLCLQELIYELVAIVLVPLDLGRDIFTKNGDGEAP
jgi:hypothetical protein